MQMDFLKVLLLSLDLLISRHPVQKSKFDFKGDQKNGRIQPENFCVCAPENCPLQDGAESWTYWATI